MHFAHPWLLVLLAVPAILAWWDVRRRGTEVRLPFDYGETALRPWLRVALGAANTLPTLLLAVAVVLLARPQKQLLGDNVRDVRNIQLIVDISGSMKASYGHGTRYQAAMAAMRKFVHHRAGDAFGLSAMAVHVIHWLPLTKDLSGFDMAEPFLDPRRLPAGESSGTYIGRALESVKTRLDAVPGDRTIILLTDGEADDLGVQRTTDIGRALAADHITVFSIFIGKGESSADIGRIAERTGGRLFTPDNPVALAETFRRIDAMQPVRQTPVTLSTVDAMRSALWVGIAALTLTLTTNFGLRYTPW